LRLERLRKLRTEAGMTQAELAQKSGVSQPEVSRIENGMEAGDYVTILLSRALNVGVEEMVEPVGPVSINVEPEEVTPTMSFLRAYRRNPSGVMSAITRGEDV
jgi:transcriptional regulator with XRE-family HTH domain